MVFNESFPMELLSSSTTSAIINATGAHLDPPDTTHLRKKIPGLLVKGISHTLHANAVFLFYKHPIQDVQRERKELNRNYSRGEKYTPRKDYNPILSQTFHNVRHSKSECETVITMNLEI